MQILNGNLLHHLLAEKIIKYLLRSLEFEVKKALAYLDEVAELSASDLNIDSVKYRLIRFITQNEHGMKSISVFIGNLMISLI
jgi:hypothetical protein